MHYKTSPFLQILTQEIDIQKRETEGGIIYLKSTLELKPHPHRMTARLLHWAKQKSNTVFLGEKNEQGEWETITFQETHKKVEQLAQWLLNQNVSVERPIAIIAGNSIKHGLLALAALHIGVPFSTITPAYVTKSSTYTKLQFVLDQLTPGVIMVSDEVATTDVLQTVPHHSVVLYQNHAPKGDFPKTSFEEALKTQASAQVAQAYQAIQPDTIAKVLFTSGSTGIPKGVINTHRNITTNWQQITQVFPFMEEGFELIDWLPWNHTFGGNHNFGLTLFNGGSLYIDEGNPTPAGIKKTIENLRERKPTIYFNVPKGFEELIPYFRKDKTLREQFFSNLKLLFYAGAGMAQHVWDALEELAFQTTGKRILIATGLGCTESSPSAMFNTTFGSFAGMLGVPVPGLELKLVPSGGKLEARYKGGNIMPAYWRNEEATAKAFDKEGFYKTGDALKFVNRDNPNEGMIFNGRIAEDFKLNTGTWVSVGHLRPQFIKAGKGLIQDAVITGHDQAFVGAMVFLDMEFVKSTLEVEVQNVEELHQISEIRTALEDVLRAFSKQSAGSSNFIRKALIAPFLPSPELGEITDKGSINQRAVLENKSKYVDMLYAEEGNELIIEVQKTRV